jgi:hypothetical protein
MSLFRRKHESDDARNERLPAQPDQAAEEREREPLPEDAQLDERRSPGAIIAPLAGEIVAGLVEVGIVPDEAVTGPVLLEWSADGTRWQRAATDEQAEEGKAGQLRWDTASLDDGSYLLRLVVVLPGGNELTSEHVSVLVDNLGPEIRLREPLAGQMFSGLVTIAVEAEDAVSGVTLVELEISEVGKDWRKVAEAREQPFELDWDSEASSDGAYRLRVGARDGSGNLALSEPLEVEVANRPAAAELIDPGELLRGKVNLITRTPDLRASQMIFELAKAGSSDWRALGTTRAPFHLPVDTGQLDDGSYELRIESVSGDGQSVHSRRFGPYVVDNTPPAITITKPAQGETLRERAELVVEVDDAVSGPALVELSYNDGEEWIELASLEPEEGIVRGFWQVAGCRPGSCRLRAKAFDRAGNEASEEITVTIKASKGLQPERAPKPEPTPPVPPQAMAPPILPPSPAAADRFGQVPSWDWKRKREPDAEQAGAAASVPSKEAKAPQPSSEPELPAAAQAEPVTAAAPKEEVRKSAAWTWKVPSSRSEPEAGEQPEREDESAIRSKVEEERPDEPEPETEEKAKPEQEAKPEQAAKPEERVEEAEVEPAQRVRLVDSATGKEQVANEAKSAGESPDPGAADSGRVVKVDFARAARGWDLWALGALVDDTPDQDPAREEERRQVLYHLRQHASVDGRIPPGFESLIYEVFGELMPDDEGA